jgi:hypothetical protein
MQILHNEADPTTTCSRRYFFTLSTATTCHAIPVTGFNESHTVNAKHFMMISVRCCISTWPGCRRISNGDPSVLFRRDEPARDFWVHPNSSWHRENANRTRYQKTLSCLRQIARYRMNSITSLAAIIARCVGRRWRKRGSSKTTNICGRQYVLPDDHAEFPVALPRVTL